MKKLSFKDVFFVAVGIIAIAFILTMTITMFYVIIYGKVYILQVFWECYIEIPMGIIAIAGLFYFIVKRMIERFPKK